MNLDLFISRRVSTGDSHGRKSPALKVAIAAVALSVVVMILAVSIVSGFRREIVTKVLGFNPHLTIYCPGESSPLLLTQELDSIISSTPGIKSSSLSLNLPILLKTPNSFKGLYLRSISFDADSAFLHSCLRSGAIPQQSADELLISSAAARHLGVHAGDSINLFMISASIMARKMKIAGIYDSHFEAYDDFLAFAPLPMMQNIAGLSNNEGSAISITLTDFNNDREVTTELVERLNEGVLSQQILQDFAIDSARARGSNYFAWLDMLDTNVWIILSLMTIVAAFTLISGVLIIILEKVRFIGVMKALGASSRRLRHIFRLIAMKIALTGMAIGNLIAITFILLQYHFHIIPLNADAYYIDFVPVSISLPSILGINAVFLLLIYAVLILPARFVSRISPAESMRFEH